MTTRFQIVYLHPPRNETSNVFAQIPVGVFGIVNHLIEGGYTVRGYNVCMERIISPAFCVKTVLRRHDPSIVLIDLHWYEHAAGAVQLARQVRAALPGATIVLGGLTASIYAEAIMESATEIDFVVRGEAERPTRKLVDLLLRGTGDLARISGLVYREAGALVRNDIHFTRRFGGEDPFDYATFDWLHNARAYLHTTPAGITNPHRSFWLLIGAGCQFNCSYCGGSSSSQRRIFMRKRISVRDPTHVARDIGRLREAGVEVINPSLDISVFGEEYWRTLFEALGRDRVQVGMYLELFQNPSRAFVEAFARTFDVARSHLVFSPLSEDEQVRAKNGKRFTNAALLENLALCHELGVPVELAFSNNLPGRQNDRYHAWLSFVRAIREAYPRAPIIAHDIVLDPLSDMAVRPEAFDIRCSFDSFDDYYDYSAGDLQTPVRTGFVCCVL